MNGAHLHLVLNHFPVIGLIFCLAMLMAGILRKSEELTRTGMVILIAVAVIAIPVYLTGEPAEEIVEHMPGVSEQALESHQDAGKMALITLEVIGAFALLGLLMNRRPRSLPRWLAPTLLVLVIALTGWVGWTSYIGGQITHEEARPGFEAASESEEHE
jgi:uncharacterized membrane protein